MAMAIGMAIKRTSRPEGVVHTAGFGAMTRLPETLGTTVTFYPIITLIILWERAPEGQ